MSEDLSHPKFPLIPGIAGGLGPFAHVGFEKRMLELSADRFGAVCDDDFPEWIVSCVPQVPVRSEALLGKAPSPEPYLIRSFRRLEKAGADFLAVTCNTAHAFLPAIAADISLPLVHVVTETVDYVLSHYPSVRRAGLLGTTGTCRFGLFGQVFAGRGVELVYPPDSEDDSDPSNLQERLVMQAIFGPYENGKRTGGIKAGLLDEGNPSPRDLLREAASCLVEQQGAEVVILACSEISLALGPDDATVPVVDTMDVLALAMLDLAHGDRSLKDLPTPDAWPKPKK
ncbi:MAG: amino acid racemase [Planctomycetota bacterium]|nr:amino acid racemase [Planctomycetota bacterium]